MQIPILTPPSSLGVGAQGWSNPLVGRLTSSFGYRVHPIFHSLGIHAGQDIAAACGIPVRAAAAGIVLYAGPARGDGRTGNQVIIGHGDGYYTRMGHVGTDTFAVKAGDRVVAGQTVAAVGGNPVTDPFGAGNSTGCHLHFETSENNGRTPVDPVQFFALRGVKLGVDQPVSPKVDPKADPEPEPEPEEPAFVPTDFDRGHVRSVIQAKGPVATVRQLG